jgi:hypothetical protein
MIFATQESEAQQGKFQRRIETMAGKKSPKKLQRGTATKQQPLTRTPPG